VWCVARLQQLQQHRVLASLRNKQDELQAAETPQRSAVLPQSRTMVSRELQMAVSDIAEEDDELYNPCGEAVHLKNTV